MNHPRPAHAPLTQFPVCDDCLQIGGMPVTRLAQRVGSTPFYAYDRQRIAERVALLRRHLPAEVHLHYAMKANPMPALVQQMAGLVDGFDVASGGELKIALDTPMPPHRISFAGPGKSDGELSRAIAAGVVVNMESAQETERIAALGEHLGLRPRVAVRVNPDFELKSSGMKMGGGPKQFGVDAELVPELLDRIGVLGLDFQGFHIFSGSQNLKASAIEEAHEKTLQLAMRLARHAPSPVRLLNIGGGFG
ncbi:MAG: alanine racemase, partial [Sulfuricella sp.]|nr:alanine racemase [Sulfuricella sp.]